MENNRHHYNNHESKTPAPMRLWFGIFMVIFYLGIGLLLILASKTFEIFTPTVSIVIGALLVVYGIWRGYRLWKGNP